MFIAKYPNGEIVTEKQNTWNKIKDGMSSVELTFPMRLTYIDKETGEEKVAPARTISLSGFDKYYFHNEAVASFDVNMKNKSNDGQGRLVAQAIGGIKDGKVVEIRVDKGGFSKTTIFDEEGFQHRDIKTAG